MADETPKFHPREHCNRVKRSARTMGVKGAAYEVLLEILWAMDWTTGKTVMSRDMLIDLTGHHLNTIKTALRALKARGLIYAVAYEKGGHGRAQVFATRYFDLDEKGDNSCTPLDVKIITAKGYNGCRKGVQPLSQRGTTIVPPSNISNISNISKNADAPSRGKTNQGKAGELNPEQQELVVLLRTNSYSEARRIMDERKRA